jgi:glycosyltransferase involved in cell wall biosynthesis
MTRTGGGAAGERVHLCIVAHHAWGALNGGFRGHVGGVERQTTLLARGLAARGHQVDLVTWDEGQEDNKMVDGVRVLKLCRREAGLPGLRFLHPRWTSLEAALARSGSEVLYHNTAEYVTGQVAFWARRRGRRFVYSVASDMDCDERLPELRTLRERLLYRYGLHRADRVVVQTRSQARMLARAFARPSVQIPMPCPGPESLAPKPPPAPGTGRVLWIGRMAEVKRPDRLLDLAAACPELSFDLVGPGDDAYARRVLAQAARTSNVTVHGGVARPETVRFYQGASVLVCTSDREGFPNTFLEAWSHGVPVVSTVDPDGLIAERGLGAVGHDLASLAAALRGLLAEPGRWRAASEASRRYYLENHTVEHVLSRFERLFLEVAGRGAAGAR